MNSRAIIRPAAVGDASGIGKVHVQGWREAYAGNIPAAVLDALDAERSAAGWEQAIRGGAGRLFVAERDGEIVGWAYAGPSRDPDLPTPLELNAIYVLASDYGSGIGQSLLDAVVGEADAFLWILNDNPRAAAFYRRNGFALDGAKREIDLHGALVPELRMTRRAWR